MQHLKELAAMTAVNEQLRKGHWSICCIDSAAQLLDVSARGEAYDILRALHCVDYNKMPSELRASIPDLIKQCLGIEPVYQFQSMQKEVIDISPARRMLKAIGL
ncbi:hypothetical protein [Comamonas sp. MYb69]|uniref:hypothetical protein n=1 Tax=Comamonas sp. MYb69 TaxID=1848650 RepID=UPI00309B88E6